jgi:isocitrate dehydrogenase (NAD+)
MSKRTVVTMPGDGIGKKVLPEALRILDTAGFKADYIEADIGWEFWKTEGNPLPDRTLDVIEKHRVGLFGAITSKPKKDAAEELAEELKNKGYVYYSPIVGLRQHFNLDVCIRPCRSFKGNPLNFIRKKGTGFEEPEVDAVIFRQNTEGLYAGVEWTNPPDDVRRSLETHKKMSAFSNVKSEDLAVSCRIFSRAACHRIVSSAFRYAEKFGYSSVTVCEKPNVVRETSGMMIEEAKKISEEFPKIKLKTTNIDAQMMWLTKNPEDYGIIVSGNLFGDIVSDAFAGLVGGLGFACSANIGKDCAIFEPTHGSAPIYADFEPSIVNPIAMILSACMMLDYLDEQGTAKRIRNAIAKVIAEGKVRTYDMLRMKGSPDVLRSGAASTTEITDAIIKNL